MQLQVHVTPVAQFAASANVRLGNAAACAELLLRRGATQKAAAAFLRACNTAAKLRQMQIAASGQGHATLAQPAGQMAPEDAAVEGQPDLPVAGQAAAGAAEIAEQPALPAAADLQEMAPEQDGSHQTAVPPAVAAPGDGLPHEGASTKPAAVPPVTAGVLFVQRLLAEPASAGAAAQQEASMPRGQQHAVAAPAGEPSSEVAVLAAAAAQPVQQAAGDSIPGAAHQQPQPAAIGSPPDDLLQDVQQLVSVQPHQQTALWHRKKVHVRGFRPASMCPHD